MIKLRGVGADGRPFVMLGIDKKNVIRLQAGEPILVDGKQMGIEFDVMISYKDELKDHLRELRELGVELPTPTIGQAHPLVRKGQGDRDVN